MTCRKPSYPHEIVKKQNATSFLDKTAESSQTKIKKLL